MLVIPLETLAFIIVKAREFDAEVPIEPDAATGSDPPDDDERQVLLDTPDNPTEQELRDAIDGLGDLERQELLALMWLGRGDYDAGSWPEALREAGESRIASVTDYLVGTPVFGDYLEEGALPWGSRSRISREGKCRTSRHRICRRRFAGSRRTLRKPSCRRSTAVGNPMPTGSSRAGGDRLPRRLGHGQKALSQAGR